MAALYKHLAFAGVKLVTLAEGEIASMVALTLSAYANTARDGAASAVFQRSVKMVAGTRNYRQFLITTEV